MVWLCLIFGLVRFGFGLVVFAFGLVVLGSIWFRLSLICFDSFVFSSVLDWIGLVGLLFVFGLVWCDDHVIWQ